MVFLVEPKLMVLTARIQMSDRVYQAFLQQKSLNNGKSEFVFCNRDGGPLDYRLVNKRVWHPILRFLGLNAS